MPTKLRGWPSVQLLTLIQSVKTQGKTMTAAMTTSAGMTKGQ